MQYGFKKLMPEFAASIRSNI